MQKLLAFVLAAALVVPTIASAAVPGVNLGWNNCSTTGASENKAFACNDNAATFNLIGSFKLAADMTDFVGISAVVDFRLNDAGTPACRRAAVVPGPVLPASVDAGHAAPSGRSAKKCWKCSCSRRRTARTKQRILSRCGRSPVGCGRTICMES